VELSTPEQAFVNQEDDLTEENTNMFFIAKGDCDVKVRDKIGDIVEECVARTLNPGDHFGEISMIYGCPRTASVIANNYCTLSRLTKHHFEELVQKYPELISRFKDRVFHYDDHVKLFLEKVIDSISYFKFLSHHAKHEILYKFKRVNFEKGGMLFKIGDIAKQLFVIQSGVVEITHTCEGQPFVIERLYRESVMNHSSFLLEDDNDANAICATTVSVFALHYEDLAVLRLKYHDLDQEIQKIETEMLNKEYPIALDYMIKVPKDRRRTRPFEVENRRNFLTVKLKNVVMQQWLEIKETLKKPSIKDIL
jgi:CRP-like cAMP-binding protein